MKIIAPFFYYFLGLATEHSQYSPEEMCMCKNHWRGCWETQNGFLSPLHTMCEHNLRSESGAWVPAPHYPNKLNRDMASM